MNNSIQFEENQYSPARRKQKRNGMADLLVQNGIAQNAAQATMILSAIIIICMLATGAVILFSLQSNTVYEVEPPLEERTANFQ